MGWLTSKAKQVLMAAVPIGPFVLRGSASSPTPASCPIWEVGDISKFPTSPNSLTSLLSVFIVPGSVLGGLRCVTPSGRSGKSCIHSPKGLLASVQAPFPGRLAPASGQSQGCQCVAEVGENGILLGSESGCRMMVPRSTHSLVVPGLSSLLHPREEACTLPEWLGSLKGTLASAPHCR